MKIDFDKIAADIIRDNRELRAEREAMVEALCRPIPDPALAIIAEIEGDDCPEETRH